MSSQVLDVVNVLQKHHDRLIKDHKVRRTGVGFKIKDGKVTDTIAIVAFVRYKPTIDILTKQNIAPIPPKIEDIPTDVIGIPTGFMPRINRLLETAVIPDDSRHRPFSGGVATINARERATGTLGLLVQKLHDSSNKLYAITNNHVGANEDVDGLPSTANKGDPWIQPGAHGHGTVPDDVIATLFEWNRIKPAGSDQVNFYDFALGQIMDSSMSDAKAYQVMDIGDVKGIEDINLGDMVMKRGRTTLKTTGRVTAMSVSTTVDYQGIPCGYENQIVITGFPDPQTPFSLPGDSGSVIVSIDKNPQTNAYSVKALLFAGGQGDDGIDHTVASPIKRIAQDFNLNI
jgi:hypothetical protein